MTQDNPEPPEDREDDEAPEVNVVQLGSDGHPVNVVSGSVGTVIQINGDFTGELNL